MAGFTYEHNLPHQERAVKSVLAVFNNATKEVNINQILATRSNPCISLTKAQFSKNIQEIQKYNDIDTKKYHDRDSNIVDISMETGTGKTYTYTKMMFELNQNLGQCKFIIVVPTLSIKAGTINFLESSATREHFRNIYSKEVNLYIVESKKNTKAKKEVLPQAISDFVSKQIQPDKEIEVLIINQGMLNSDTMGKRYQKMLNDMFDNPFEALESISPIIIIDEPHRFKQDNKTFKNIEKIKAQWIFRFGATFDGKEKNLVYRLDSVQAFNDDLVKGVKIFISDFNDTAQENAKLKLIDFNKNEATFELDGKQHIIHKAQPMKEIHPDLGNLQIENIAKNFVLLSNGLKITKEKDNIINPYSYNETLAERMVKQAIEEHFRLEQTFFKRRDKIKPLTLFFIDDIDGYRNEDGAFKKFFEQLLVTKIKKVLKDEYARHDRNKTYIKYLEKSLQNITLTHGGYFSKDNSDSDEKIEQEINEILHDKESLLSIDNPRRFIFSKWTLREGWDNPNVFGICKLRSSGSVTSKLQEVGRGLRLPVNEYGSRIKDGGFYLNYFVDFTEKDFAEGLISEINSKSNIADFSENEKLSDELIQAICNSYENLENDSLLNELGGKGIIDFSRNFKENGFNELKKLYPQAFIDRGVRKSKIINSGDEKQMAHIRTGKYDELKELWEKINQKAILQYNIKDEKTFLDLLASFLKENKSNFKVGAVVSKEQTMKFDGNMAYYETSFNISEEILPISYMKYGEFLLKLSSELKANINTLHQAFCKIYREQDKIDINNFLSNQTIRFIKHGFSKYILDNSISNFSVKYQKIQNLINIHPTKFTDKDGKPLSEIQAGNLGAEKSDGVAVSSYLFDEIYFDSELEKENISENIDTITVFTKIPKNSIRIPVSGGGSYSPDFAYVIQDKEANKTLHLIVEVKNKEERDLLSDEKQKIAHAKKFFEAIDDNVKIDFKTQFATQKIKDLISEIMRR